MCKRNLKPLKLESPEKFEGLIRTLWDECFWAHWYYEIFKEASRLCRAHKEAVEFAPYFWRFTLQAHFQIAMIHLHRIYDLNRESFNLHRFLITIRDNKEIFDPAEVRARRKADPHADELIQAIGVLDLAQLERDIGFSSEANPKVANLKTWRDRVVFHKDERELFRQTPFEKDYPLSFGDVDELLGECLKILNRYSQYFDTTIFSTGCREWKDMGFVFEALEHHPAFVRRQADTRKLTAMGLD